MCPILGNDRALCRVYVVSMPHSLSSIFSFYFSFTNTLEVTERTAALVLFPDPAIDFTCDFSSIVSGISANHQIAANKITTEGSNGVGSFQYELDFMVRTPQGTRFQQYV